MLPHHYLLALCFSISALAQTRTQCQTSVASPPPKYKIHCAEQGMLMNPKVIGSSTVGSLNQCRDKCLNDKNCKSFSFDTTSLECTTYKTSLDRQGFRKAQNGIQNYHRNCFTVDHCTVFITTGHYTVNELASATFYGGLCTATASVSASATCSCIACSNIPTPTGTDCPRNRAALYGGLAVQASVSCPVTTTITDCMPTSSMPMSSIPMSSIPLSSVLMDFIPVRGQRKAGSATVTGRNGAATISRPGYMSAGAQETHRA